MSVERRGMLLQLMAAALAFGEAPLAQAAPRRRPHAPGYHRRPKPTVVIDPGHGGKDPGCIGCGGIEEKAVVLALGHELAHQLQATRRFRVAMTRETDVFVPLERRVAIAREHHASLLISLHANASPNAHAGGAAVYRFAYRPSNAAAAAMARWENSRDRDGSWVFRNASPVVAHILASLMRRETWLHAARLQHCIVDRLRPCLQPSSVQADHAHFIVLSAPDIASVLIESGFLTNPRGARLLHSPHHRRLLARAIRQGVERYVA